jgi:hypothetical protein
MRGIAATSAANAAVSAMSFSCVRRASGVSGVPSRCFPVRIAESSVARCRATEAFRPSEKNFDPIRFM